MEIRIFPDKDRANEAAAECLTAWVAGPGTCNVMLAGGNTPLTLYRHIADRKLDLSRLIVFALDEYVGVPPDEPRNCANLLRSSAVEPWGISPERFFKLSPNETDALESVRQHEQRIQELGGLDVVVLGLGQNGHLGFNEPGSTADSEGRLVPLEKSSIEANREWFAGVYAPAFGVTVGLRTILGARRILLMAYGPHKRASVARMLEGSMGPDCPASFLQRHPQAYVFLDEFAAAGLSQRR